MRTIGFLFAVMASVVMCPLSYSARYRATPAADNSPTPKAPLTLRIVGSSVKNQKGEYLGRIQEVVLNPYTSQAEFAMLLIDYPKNTARVTPVPWSLLTYLSDQGQGGGQPGAQQVFQLNMDRVELLRMPVLDKSRWGLIGQPDWRQRIYSLYGLASTPAPTPTPTAQTAGGEEVPAYFIPYGGPVISGSSSSSSSFAFLNNSTNALPANQNFPFGFPFANFPSALNSSTIPTNFPPLFPGGEPVIPNGPDMFRAATNFFPGAPATLPSNPNAQNNSQNQPLVPLKPGSPFSPLVPANATPGTPQVPGSPWSPIIPAGSPAPLVPLKPGSAWSPLIPAGSAQGVPANPGSAWSPILPPGSTPIVIANGLGAFSPALAAAAPVPQSAPVAGSGPRRPPGAPRPFSPFIPNMGGPGMPPPPMPPPRLAPLPPIRR